jgi:hypothetical protein
MNFLANLMLSDRSRGPPRSAERTARDQRQKQRQTEERAGPTKRPAAGNQTSDSLIPTLRKLYEDNATGIFPFFSFLFFFVSVFFARFLTSAYYQVPICLERSWLKYLIHWAN